MIVLKLKHFKYRIHSLYNMFDYNKDKQSYLVTKVILMAAVNPSTTTTIIYIPVKNLPDTKDIQG